MTCPPLTKLSCCSQAGESADVATPATPTTPMLARDTSSGGASMTTAIAYACAALLIVGAVVAAWWHSKASTNGGVGDDDEVKGMSMSFANPGFQAPRSVGYHKSGRVTTLPVSTSWSSLTLASPRVLKTWGVRVGKH